MHTQEVALTSEVSTNEISGSELEQVAVALQSQAFHGLNKAWHINATVQSYTDPKSVPPSAWKIVVSDQLDDPQALGYHTDEHNQPISKVMYQPGPSGWPTTASHEGVEMLGDAWGNRLYKAPSPDPSAPPHHYVQILLELADPPEAAQFGYTVNGVTMSDFLLHSYGNGHVGPFDYCGHIQHARQVLDGGYISWVEPDGTWKQLTNFGSMQVNVLGRIEGRVPSLREWVDSHPNGASQYLRKQALNGA